MQIKRRDFVKGCAATCALLVPGISWGARDASIIKTSDARAQIEKSIKASFGGSFSVRTHGSSNGLTHADIEHFDTRYTVTSADLLDWKIVRSV
ncbi:twin-arginine translocation signal domain-containing protein [Allopusillimonas ginsengisoli]|uniref:twin-arginine translocation signal domain-containing protein n=1 Tax=Allopusillimonas ginsengisoli TaxID=453575 RepID=UPI0039C218BC